MRAHELIFSDEGKLVGSSEIKLDSISRVENGWMTDEGVYIPNSKILISLGDIDDINTDDNNYGHII